MCRQLLQKLQEKNITYSPKSALNSDLHPVRPGAQQTYDEPSSDENEDSEAEEKPIEEKSETKEKPVEEKSETEGENK